MWFWHSRTGDLCSLGIWPGLMLSHLVYDMLIKKDKTFNHQPFSVGLLRILAAKGVFFCGWDEPAGIVDQTWGDRLKFLPNIGFFLYTIVRGRNIRFWYFLGFELSAKVFQSVVSCVIFYPDTVIPMPRPPGRMHSSWFALVGRNMVEKNVWKIWQPLWLKWFPVKMVYFPSFHEIPSHQKVLLREEMKKGRVYPEDMGLHMSCPFYCNCVGFGGFIFRDNIRSTCAWWTMPEVNCSTVYQVYSELFQNLAEQQKRH